MDLFKRKARKSWILIVIVCCISITRMAAQDTFIINGTIQDELNKQTIPYATVALYSVLDSTLAGGTLSNDEGHFELQIQQPSEYFLKISYTGYKPCTKKLKSTGKDIVDIGTIYLQEETIEINEAVILADRIKAKKSYDKTTFFINKKIQDASNTGVDILKHIPGIQVDFMQNIALEGSQNIIILVDGKERDKGFLHQLNANQIDKVEIVNTPGAKYDANVTGAINIILKKDKNTGISGNVVVDIPVKESEMYLFPSLNLNVGLKKLNLFCSYNAEIAYFDLIENKTISYENSDLITRQLSTREYLRQKNWEQRFSYGLDYFLNDKNQFSFYGFFGPYSNETDGRINMFDSNSENAHWLADNEDSDINLPSYYSVYYKHLFNKEGHEISVDVNYYNFKRENTILYKNNVIDSSQSGDIVNSIKPKQNTFGFKLDYVAPLNEKFKIDAGIKIKLTSMEDDLSEEFNYNDNIFSGYGALTYNKSKMTLSTGLRIEESTSGITDQFDHENVSWLPNALINYKINAKQNLKLAYSRKITRPHIYQLNPTTYIDDPFRLHGGNEQLNPELRDNITLDYSISLGDNYISTGIFYTRLSDYINSLTFLNDSNVIESRFNNLGDMDFYGIQITSALKLHKAIAVNTYFRCFGGTSRPNSLSIEHGIKSRVKVAYDVGISTIFSFKYDITASLTMQYNSPKYDIQTKSFNELIYFITVEKAIKKKLKLGLVCAPLFAKEYTYTGLETEDPGFKTHYDGNVLLTDIPFWFKLSYNFSSGKKIKSINRSKEIIDNKENVGM